MYSKKFIDCEKSQFLLISADSKLVNYKLWSFFCAVLLTITAGFVWISYSNNQKFEELFTKYVNDQHVEVGDNAASLREIFAVHNTFISKHNDLYERKEVSFKVGFNKFSQLNLDQKKSMMMKVDIDGDDDEDDEVIPHVEFDDFTADNSNDSYRLPNEAVLDVQYQGHCGSCYAFASIAAIEGARFMQLGISQKLSEHEAAMCTNACDGGLDEWVYHYANRTSGIASAINLPYDAVELMNVSEYFYARKLDQDSQCEDYQKLHEKNTKVFDWFNTAQENVTMTESYIKYILRTKGSLYIGVQVDEQFVHYSSGVYDKVGGEVLGGHAMVIVGYGTEEESELDYWLVKNSWGKSWGENGFVKILRGKNFLDIENGEASYPVMKK